ncbi:MAG: ornithine carbamoyltransferase [Anaerolineales bacterium]
MYNFLAISDCTSEELNRLLVLAVRLKKERRDGGNKPVLAGKNLAMVCQKPRLRTRVSFEMGMRHLGGDALYLSPDEIGLGKREAIRDVSRVLSGYVDGIMARVFAHEHVLELARHASVPVINGLSDYNHPCQAMADVLTILEPFGSLEGINLTYVGDGNNVAVSLIFACALLDMNFTIASPQGYSLPESVFSEARSLAGNSNQQLVAEADPQAIVLHCLPAHRGQEITDEVMDGEQSRIFQQAENRMHAQKAILVELLR